MVRKALIIILFAILGGMVLLYFLGGETAQRTIEEPVLLEEGRAA